MAFADIFGKWDAGKFRQDFPIFSQKKKFVYFDNACLTFKPKQVIDAMNEYYTEYTACGSRSMHQFGKKVTDKVDGARKEAQKFFNAGKPEEIVFTRNTTEGINIVLHSLDIKKGDVMLSSDKEHNSNLLPCQKIAKLKGAEHKIVFSNPDNTFSMDNFEKALSKKVKLVSVVHTSNLDGVAFPVKEIIKRAHEEGALVLLDAAQAAPHREVDVKALDADFLACSGHKMLGPTGTGILYGKHELLEQLEPFMVGGETVSDSTYEGATFEGPPHKFEPGLQDYAGLIGLGEALKYLKGKLHFTVKHEHMLNKKITDELLQVRGLRLIGPEDAALRGGIASFYVDGVESHNLANVLDASHSIMVRSGRHCVHSWFNHHGIFGSVRASLYLDNTEEEAALFCDAVKKAAVVLQK